MATIYVQLLDEGTDVWRPVEAAQVAEQLWRIEGEVPEGEAWEFAPGSVVHCEWRIFSGGKRGLTAIGRAGAD